jgi:hypothetical protein
MKVMLVMWCLSWKRTSTVVSEKSWLGTCWRRCWQMLLSIMSSCKHLFWCQWEAFCCNFLLTVILLVCSLWLKIGCKLTSVIEKSKLWVRNTPTQPQLQVEAAGLTWKSIYGRRPEKQMASWIIDVLTLFYDFPISICFLCMTHLLPFFNLKSVSYCFCVFIYVVFCVCVKFGLCVI